MLTNSLLLSLQHLLPIGILLALLLAMGKPKVVLILSLLIGLVMALLLSLLLPHISQWFAGKGSELLQVFMLCTMLVLVLLTLATNKLSMHFSALLCVFCIAHFGSGLVLYINQFWTMQGDKLPMTAGILLAIGISASLSTLLFLSLLGLGQRQWVRWALCLFITGQFATVANLLEQVDLLPGFAPLWNSQAWLNESAELGQLLKALVGYEATPNINFLLCYWLTLAITLITAHRYSNRQDQYPHLETAQ